MTAQRVEDLIDLLITGTKVGTLKWEPTADEDTFRLRSSAANVRVTRTEGYNREEESEFTARRLSVLNDTGRLVEEYDPSGHQQLEKFDSLFAEARRSAHNTEEVLDKLMKELRRKVS